MKDTKPGREFCAQLSIEAGEPLEGTGAHKTRLVMIRWPKRTWEYSPRVASDMPDALAAAIEQLTEAGWRVNLIDHKTHTQQGVFVYPHGRYFALSAANIAAFLQALSADEIVLKETASAPIARELITCCTHGNHDRCCAKFGFAAFKSLDAQVAQHYPNRYQVWESTHLGGCRLSATVLFPASRRKYGRMRPEHIAHVLQAESLGRPYLPQYRGATDLSPAAQCAEIAARHADSALAECAQLQVVEIGDRVFRVQHPHAQAHSIDVRCIAQRLYSHGACDDIDAGLDAPERVVWVAQLMG